MPGSPGTLRNSECAESYFGLRGYGSGNMYSCKVMCDAMHSSCSMLKNEYSPPSLPKALN